MEDNMRSFLTYFIRLYEFKISLQEESEPKSTPSLLDYLRLDNSLVGQTIFSAAKYFL